MNYQILYLSLICLISSLVPSCESAFFYKSSVVSRQQLFISLVFGTSTFSSIYYGAFALHIIGGILDVVTLFKPFALLYRSLILWRKRVEVF